MSDPDFCEETPGAALVERSEGGARDDPWTVEGGDLGHRLVTLFAAFGPAYMKWLGAGAREAGLTYPRMRLLHVLRCGGPQIMSSLRDELGVTARSVTSLVDGLEAEGLVGRRGHPRDRRATVVELTPAGRRTMQGLFESHTRRAAALFESLDDDEQRDLARLMSRLTDELRRLADEEAQ